jgi:SAM-dependent methyltransferase
MSTLKPPVHFDDYLGTYDSDLENALSITGESREYYAQGRIGWSAECAKELGAASNVVIDFGCGDGSNTDLLVRNFGATSLVGVDVSAKSIAHARGRYARANVSFYEVKDFQPDGTADIVYCNGVFHHIPLEQRDSALQYVFQALKPGGLFALWENNPFNPGTRYVMANCEFDHDAIMLWPRESIRRLKAGGFKILRKDSLFYFPSSFKLLRRLEKPLSRLLLGGQYHILSEKP